MRFLARFIREIDVSATARSSLPFDDSVEKFVAALKQSRLKVPVRLDVAGISRKVDRSWRLALFGSASVFRAKITQTDGILHLVGTIQVMPFFRVYVQVFLILGVLGSLFVFSAAAWRWSSIIAHEYRSDLSLVEIAAAGLGGTVMFIMFVKFLATLNYLSTRGQRDKIIAAFKSLEAA